MYVSKYYTCEEIDQRLLQGYYDDFVKAGFGGTINEFWAFVLSIKNKVDKKEGYDLSKNDFTDELKAKLDGIEEHANYITKVSQLENDNRIILCSYPFLSSHLFWDYISSGYLIATG